MIWIPLLAVFWSASYRPFLGFVDIERRSVVLRCVQQVVVDAIVERSGQAGVETSRAGHAPSIG